MLGLNTPLKLGIFFGYVFLWVASHLLVYASRREGAPAYNATSVVLLTELAKIALACGMYLRFDGSKLQMLEATLANTTLLAKYFVPALLYCLLNNLIYVNLAVFDPGTYNVLLQLKIALTGLAYQMLLGKQLNRNQWGSLMLITLGCIVKESGKLQAGLSDALKSNLWSWLLLFLQMNCSVFAGVYTEVLLKNEQDVRVTTNLQNVFMYFDSIICNVGVMVVQGTLGEALSLDNMSVVFTPAVLSIVGIMSSVGLVVGFFLKHLDSVLKAIAGALEVVFTMIFSFLLFGTEMTLSSLLSALIVGGGVALYSRPVSTAEQKAETPKVETQMQTVIGAKAQGPAE